MSTLGFLLALLSHFVNPWCVVLVVVLILFRTEIRRLILSLGDLASRVDHFEFKGLRVSSERRASLAQALSALTQPEIEQLTGTETQPIITPERAGQLAEQIVARMDPKHLSSFLAAFDDTNVVVVRTGSQQDEMLERLLPTGLVEKAAVTMLGLSGRGRTEWRISRLGALARAVWLLRVLEGERTPT